MPAPSSSIGRRFTDVCWSAVCSLNGLRECKLGRDVEVRDARGRGRGVFALRDIPANALVCRYDADLRSSGDQEQAARAGLTTGDYAMALGSDWVLDAESEGSSNYARYVNHSLRRCNLRAGLMNMPSWVCWLPNVPTTPCALYFETMRPIAAGEELCIDYGSEYWDKTTALGYRLHDQLPVLSPLWRLHPRRLMIDYW